MHDKIIEHAVDALQSQLSVTRILIESRGNVSGIEEVLEDLRNDPDLHYLLALGQTSESAARKNVRVQAFGLEHG